MRIFKFVSAFLHLRRTKPQLERPFKVPGDGLLLYISYVPMVLITLAAHTFSKVLSTVPLGTH